MHTKFHEDPSKIHLLPPFFYFNLAPLTSKWGEVLIMLFYPQLKSSQQNIAIMDDLT